MGTERRRDLTDAGEGRPRRGYGLLAGQLLFGVVLVSAVAAGLLAVVRSNAAQSSGVPSEIDGMRVEQLVTGPQALQSINRLHGTEVVLIRGWVAEYGHGASVWVGTAVDEEQARDLVARMTDAIGRGTSPFKLRGQRNQDGLTLYEADDGRGQRHFYYQTGSQVVWIAAPAGDGGSFLNDTIRQLK